MSAEHHLSLTHGLHAPSHARAWVSSRTSHLPREVVEDALLLVSELVTNAVRHGRPDIAVSLVLPEGTDPSGGTVRVEVYDAGDDLPIVPLSQPALDHPTGRGLLIVAATASDWGVDRIAGQPGKRVWADIPIDQPQ